MRGRTRTSTACASGRRRCSALGQGLGEVKQDPALALASRNFYALFHVNLIKAVIGLEDKHAIRSRLEDAFAFQIAGFGRQPGCRSEDLPE